MTSIIPFFILLLTTYTFAAPVGQENSTIEYELTTGQTTNSTDFISNNLSTAVPIIQQQQSTEDSNSTEVTTDSVTRLPRANQADFNAAPNNIYEKRSGDYPSDSQESGNSEKRESQESLISTSSKDYKKRSDAASQDSLENNSNEKRAVNRNAIPTTTRGYKKRNDAASQESIESNSNEKRDAQESLISTSATDYEKRSNAESQESLESNSSEKRESVLPTTTRGYKKRNDAASEESLENNSNEKRDSQESLISKSATDYEKRSNAESQESLENQSNEKRMFNMTKPGLNQSVVSTSTQGYKKNTPKSYLFTTLESSTVFNRRAIRPPVASQEEPESASVEQPMKMSSRVKPSSSPYSSGKATGPLNNKPVDQSSEEFQGQVPAQRQKFTKTVSVIPGKVRKTEVVPNVPSKSAAMMQPMQQEQQQLSRGQSQSEY